MPAEDSFHLFEMTWQEAAERLRSARVALLPTGAVEAHGPHLPLGADVIIARGTADAGARALEAASVPAIVLPALPYAVTYVSSVFPGTVGITPAALGAVVTDIGRSLARQGIRTLCLCNAHLEPANVETLKRAAATVEWEAGIKADAIDLREERWAQRLSEEFRRGARHAGAYETALLMALRPDLVREERRRGLAPLWIDLPARLREGARTFKDAGSELAYFGDPAAATREEGERLLEALGGIVRDCVLAMQPA